MFIHSYVNYCNTLWTSNTETKCEKILKKQKYAVSHIYKRNKFSHVQPLMRGMNILNVYQILRTLNKVKDNINPKVFDKIFEEIQLKYQSRYSNINFEKPKATPKTTDIATFPRGVHI